MTDKKPKHDPARLSPGTAVGVLVFEWTKVANRRKTVENAWPRLAEIIEILAESSSYADQRKRNQ